MNKRKIIKIVAIVLACLILAGAVFAGVYAILRKKNLPTNEEAVEIMTELLPKAEKLSPIIWGEPVVLEGEESVLDNLPTFTADVYKRADTEYYGYSSVDEIRAALNEVYCESYVKDELEVSLFAGSSDEIADIYPKFKMNSNNELLVNDDYVGFKVGMKADPKTAVVKGYKKHFDFKMIEVELQAVLPNGDEAPVTLTIYKQGEGEWRLYDPLY